MTTLQDILNLAKADGNKFFVIDEKGEPKLIIMSVEDYQTLLLGKVKREVEDIEQINKEIIQAQLKEEILPPSMAQSGTDAKSHHAYVDMREEVIDPSFDFEGPKVSIEDI